MPYVSFHDSFPELARRETRTVTLEGSSSFELPPGEYALLEMYCDERGCDCRRVFFYVVASHLDSPAAVVAFGWEPAEFYAKWMGEDDPDVLDQLMGPALNLASAQSAYAPEILRLIEEVLLQDPDYVQRLRAHYDLFRCRVDGPRSSGRAGRKAERGAIYATLENYDLIPRTRDGVPLGRVEGEEDS